MRYVFIFAGVFITLYVGAFFYVGVKDFDYSGGHKTAAITQPLHSS